jgi:hypothetical protein
MKFDLIRDILDKQLIDRSGVKMGRADGVVISWTEGEQPVVHHLELGAEVLAHRVGRPFVRLVQWGRRRFPVREESVQIILWPAVGEITSHHLKIDLDAETSPAFAWERWLRKHIVEKIPRAAK